LSIQLHNSNAVNETNKAASVDQLYSLLQKQLNSWSSINDGTKTSTDGIYPQAIRLAQQFDNAYKQHPGKLIAQLHNHKPHYASVTNLTAKAVIFTTLLVAQQQWSRLPRISLIAATLTSNIATLSLLAKQTAKQGLTSNEKSRLARSTALSYRLLFENKVPDPLWLHSLSSALPTGQAKKYPLGLNGAIVRTANRFASLLMPTAGEPNQTPSDALKALYLNDSRLSMQLIITQAAQRLSTLCQGSLLMLANQQLALVMHSVNTNSHLVFLFAGSQLSLKGRFTLITNRHIDQLLPGYDCEEAKLYSLLWEGPLKKYAAQKQLDLNQPTQPYSEPQEKDELTDDTTDEQPAERTDSAAQAPDNSDIFTPPAYLAQLVADLFAQPNLGKISEQIEHSETLSLWLAKTASQCVTKNNTAGVFKDTKHAIAMLGLNRLGPLLIQGSLMSAVVKQQFPGYQLVSNRQTCLIQALNYYGQFSDLVSKEEITLYATFWLAPLYLTQELQLSACRLYRQKSLDLEAMFSLVSLFGVKLTDTHKEQTLALARSWQLPQLSLEVIRQLNSPQSTTRVAKKVEQVLAVVRLATFHTHTIFNQLDISSAYLQDNLRKQLTTLDMAMGQYLEHQDLFLINHSPYTPLI
jgi:hypothetical protein